MAQEIERKFLIHKKLWDNLQKPAPVLIEQNYIFNAKPLTLRTRIKGNKGYITLKKGKGITRLEYEYEIPISDAKELMMIDSSSTPIEKKRYSIDYKGKTWEVDVFLGLNKGLIIAEIELNDENEPFEIPIWIDKEVSSISKYLNSNLQNKPFNQW